MSKLGTSSDALTAEGASIYPPTDARYKNFPQHFNAIIESELVKHKISIEELFRESQINKDYIFMRKIE